MTGAVRDGGDRLRVGVVVPAAGAGTRMGGVRKAFLELRGEPILARALHPVLADPRVIAVVVALAPDDAADPPRWLTALDPRIQVVAGGDTRGASVARAIAALPEPLDVIAVHDGARPLVTAAVVRSCIDVASRGVGAVAGCPAVDTIKVVGDDGIVTATPDRRTLWHAHTPQAFPAGDLVRAYRTGGERATDDAALVEAIGGRIRMVDDGGTNLKVTRPADVEVAEAILLSRGTG